MGLTYKAAGVNIDAGNKLVGRIKNDVEATFSSSVLTGIGGFGGLFRPDLGSYKDPVFVSGTDGVGTKLKIAFKMDRHDTIGVDLVAMCVNDILACGARPLFFLDYLATGKLKVEKASEIIRGITTGCKEAGCALIGGETAELPGFYNQDEYDLAGFTVGIVDRKNIISGNNIKPGDSVIGFASSGLHSNGFSLARKVLLEMGKYSLEDRLEGLDNILGEELLKPTRIYVKPVLELIKKFQIKGIAHITGGGLLENIPRVLPEGVKAVVNKNKWPLHSIFEIIQRIGKIKEAEMYRTFNMGIGLVLVVPRDEATKITREAIELGEKAYIIGEIVQGEKAVELN